MLNPVIKYRYRFNVFEFRLFRGKINWLSGKFSSIKQCKRDSIFGINHRGRGGKNRACVTRIKAHIHFNRCDPKSFSNDFNACARFDVGVSSFFDFIYLTSTEVFEVLDGKVLCEYPKTT